MLNQYGSSISTRIQYLCDNLTDEEQKKFYRLNSFIKIFHVCSGGSFDFGQDTHSQFFSETQMYALRQIDAVFFTKFGQHIEQHAFQLEMTDNEWQNGIKPASH